MKYSIRIPGKTFCFGEYAALSGSPALLVATSPGFEMRIGKSENKQNNPFHPLSPAGKYYELEQEFFGDWYVEFVDHYQGRGGFGASTAQFLGLCFFKRQINSASLPEKNYHSIWSDYHNINRLLKPTIDKSQLPSGYDLWSQLLGGFTLIKKLDQEKHVQFLSNRSDWPFADLGYLVVPTGFKLATHNHLDQIDPKTIKHLANKTEQVQKTWAKKNQGEFLSQMKGWQSELIKLGLVHENTKKLLTQLEAHSEILFVKGCGAMGADILFILYLHKDLDRVKTILSEMKFKDVYDSRDLWEKEIKVQAV